MLAHRPCYVRGLKIDLEVIPHLMPHYAPFSLMEIACQAGARAVMPLRWGGTPRIWIKGQYRRKQLKDFDTEAYHQRAIVETVHSVEKRKMGDIVLARGACQQHKELIFRAFAYNVGRLEAIVLSIIEGFYRAIPS